MQTVCRAGLCGPYPQLLQYHSPASCGLAILLAIADGLCEHWPTVSLFPMVSFSLPTTICVLVNRNNISLHLRGISMRESALLLKSSWFSSISSQTRLWTCAASCGRYIPPDRCAPVWAAQIWKLPISWSSWTLERKSWSILDTGKVDSKCKHTSHMVRQWRFSSGLHHSRDHGILNPCWNNL